MSDLIIVPVRGGVCIRANLFENEWLSEVNGFALAVMDPPYGKIVKAKWDKISASDLSVNLTRLMLELEGYALPGAAVWLWGGIGKPKDRALYQTLIAVEKASQWQCAEQITWKKKRGYGTSWRCLMTREECLRFVLGDVRKPRVYNVQLTDELRGYAGFNKKHPAKSEFKRLTAIWDHASDMTQNKPHECWKPPALIKSQIEMVTNRGDLVLDLFAGSGECSLVARELDRPFVCVENDPKCFESLVSRLT